MTDDNRFRRLNLVDDSRSYQFDCWDPIDGYLTGSCSLANPFSDLSEDNYDSRGSRVVVGDFTPLKGGGYAVLLKVRLLEQSPGDVAVAIVDYDGSEVKRKVLFGSSHGARPYHITQSDDGVIWVSGSLADSQSMQMIRLDEDLNIL